MHCATFRLDLLHRPRYLILATPFVASEQARSAVSVDSKTITISEGTDMAATVSPDHKTIIMDLQGLLYSMPMAGGAAKQISTPYDEDSHPIWSAKGGISRHPVLCWRNLPHLDDASRWHTTKADHHGPRR